MRILLVEDDAVLRDVMLRSLNDAGHRVDVANNVEDADHLWRVQPFDAVLLDLNLPATASPASGTASGLTALRQARTRGDRTPVLVLTARDRTEERIAGLDAGADDYLGKPFDRAEVEARLKATPELEAKTLFEMLRSEDPARFEDGQLRTLQRRVRRWRAATEAERRSLACLADRSSRPKSSPAQVPDAEARKICERREKTGWSPRRLADAAAHG